MTEEKLDKWSEETDRKKKQIAAKVKTELAGSLSSVDEDIIDEWAFEFEGI